MTMQCKYWFFFIFSLIIFVFCQLISWLIYKSNLLVFKNEKIMLVMILAVIAFIIFSLYEIKKEKGHPLFVVSLSLILGGGLSNLIDQALKGGVPDYLDLYSWRMNLADIFIFAGIFLFFFGYYSQKKKLK